MKIYLLKRDAKRKNRLFNGRPKAENTQFERKVSMDIYTKEGKKALIERHTPRSPILKNTFFAFLFGGIICAAGEAARELFMFFGTKENDATLFVSLILIALAASLTALGVFDTIAKRAGAGTLVPITGFSNAVSSQAIDARSEGYVLGVGAKIFTVSGPVILYGICAGVVYGAIYYLVGEILKMSNMVIF